MQGRRNDSFWREQPRLPAIAPRHGTVLPSSERNIGPPNDPPDESRRSRIPPRSRSGCWTCRTRKVKCDEQRPTCGQCVRLGHMCDYNPRLAFRDDTPRVIERMQDVRKSGSFVWDPNTSEPDANLDRSREDILPAFSTLTTDEEREQKAELQEPGTYMVVANPKSFANLPEYREEEILRSTASPVSSRSYAMSKSRSPEYGGRARNEQDDPNTIILKVFEDNNSRRSPTTTPIMTLPATGVPVIQQAGRTAEAGNFPPNLDYGASGISRLDEARNGGRDAQLLQYYRTTISPAIMQADHPNAHEDMFEIQARTFPPLFHAMMALSALSFANRNNMHHADALEHYQQVIPAMRVTIRRQEDSISDGALFTHYLLLLYEIANSRPWQSNMWQHHCDRLLSIVRARQQANGTEPQAFVVWMVCLIDTYALLSGSGSGGLVETVLKNNIIPAPHTLPNLSRGHPQRLLQEEVGHFPAVLDLNQQVVTLAVRIGITARDMRNEAALRNSSDAGTMSSGYDSYTINQQARLGAIQSLCHDSYRSWAVRYPRYWPRPTGSERPPPRVNCCLEQSQILYRVSVIYCYTSMYPGQNSHRSPETNIELATCVAEILGIASRIMSEERWESKWITFSLFLAGFISTNPNEKTMAYNMLGMLEQHCYGGNTAVTKQFLGMLYSQQQQVVAQGGQPCDVDWIEEMRRKDLRLVIFGDWYPRIGNISEDYRIS